MPFHEEDGTAAASVLVSVAPPGEGGFPDEVMPALVLSCFSRLFRGSSSSFSFSAFGDGVIGTPPPDAPFLVCPAEAPPPGQWAADDLLGGMLNVDAVDVDVDIADDADRTLSRSALPVVRRSPSTNRSLDAVSKISVFLRV